MSSEKVKNFVSFSIYGDIEKYLKIIEYNINFLKKYNFDVVVYCDDINLQYLSSIFKNTLILNGFIFGIKNKMLWRLNPVFANFATSVFPRDADSKITEREINMMNEFLFSEKKFHVIRDHELHYMPIMGGLFGVKHDIFYIFKSNKILKRLRNVKNLYNHDQLFLSDYVYLKIIKCALIHTSSYRYLNENVNSVEKSISYCGMYDNINLAKFDKELDYINIVNRRPTYFLLAKFFRYKWFLFIKYK